MKLVDGFKPSPRSSQPSNVPSDSGYGLRIEGGSLRPPKEARLRRPFSIRDQGALPCCVSAAVVACMEILDATTEPVTELSMMFHYAVTRGGTAPRALDLAESLLSAGAHGVCPRSEHDIPVNADGAAVRPSASALAMARNFRIAGDAVTGLVCYRRLDDADRVGTWRKGLAVGSPVVFGFWQSDAYKTMDGGADRHGKVPGTVYRDFGHAVVARGYDDVEEGFMVVDSQGPGFGAGGEWWLPYDVVESDLIVEAWTIDRLTY